MMLAAVFFLSSMDVVVKILSTSYDTMQLVWVRYAGQVAISIVILSPKLKTHLRTNRLGMQMLRSLFLYVATICFSWG